MKYKQINIMKGQAFLTIKFFYFQTKTHLCGMF